MFGGNARRDMNGKPLFPTGVEEDRIVPIARIAPKGWAASQRNGRTCSENGTTRRMQKRRRIALRDRIKRYGGNAASAATCGRRPPTAGFVEAVVPLVQKSAAASLLSTPDKTLPIFGRVFALSGYRRCFLYNEKAVCQNLLLTYAENVIDYK